MKIALCYSGNMRTYEHCVKNHAELFQNPDVYISTWDSIDRIAKINDDWHYRFEADIQKNCDYQYIEKHTPKSFSIKGVNIEKYSSYSFSTNLHYQYHKIKDCFNLIKNPSEYDFIVRIRPDITISDISFNDNKLVFNSCIWHNYYFSNAAKKVNEMIWIAQPDLMSKSVKIYDNLEKFAKDDFCGEAVCYQNLIIEDILKDTIFFNFNYRVVR